MDEEYCVAPARECVRFVRGNLQRRILKLQGTPFALGGRNLSYERIAPVLSGLVAFSQITILNRKEIQMRSFRFFSVVLFASVICLTGCGEPKTSALQDAKIQAQANDFAQSGGRIIALKMGGVRNLETSLKKWEFDKSSRKFRLNISMSWNGAFKKGNEYALDGILVVNEDGSDADFTKTRASENLEDLIKKAEIFKFLAVQGYKLHKSLKEK